MFLEKEIQFDGTINFQKAIEIYHRIISVGFKPFNIYSLSAVNYDLEIHLISDFHFDEYDFDVFVSDDIKERDMVARLEKGVERLLQDITDSQSDDPIVANSPKVRYYQECGKWSIEDIVGEEVERIVTYKQAKYIPLIGEHFGWQLSSVRNREIRIKKENGLYQVAFIADTKQELDKIEKSFHEIVSN